MDKKLMYYVVGKMMQQDEWENEYNPDHQFDVDCHDYNSKEDYLEALRNEWKDSADFYGEYEDDVDVEDYDTYDEYEEAVEEARLEKEEEY